MFSRLTIFFLAVSMNLVAVISAMAQQQLIEIRYYHFRSADAAARFDSMLETAALPLLQQRSIGPVGVFQVTQSPTLGEHARVTIVPYASMESLLATKQALATDSDFLAKAADYLQQESGDPAYERVESMLLHTFSGMPKLEVPAVTAPQRANASESEAAPETQAAPEALEGVKAAARIFELRTYKSENEVQQALKVQMFNNGEIDIFKKTGLQAVFFGDAIIASDLPQLTYMLVHRDKATQDESWKKFIASPDWKSLSGEERYKVIKLKITAHLLQASDFSQIQ